MAVKIRLKRMGKIRAPYYRIVVADSRTKRDGRAIEEIGKYHPTQEPSLIEVDSERVKYWLGVGAQPTEQVLAILKVTGDWQKFKGLPGAEGTLRVAEPEGRQEGRCSRRPPGRPTAEAEPSGATTPAARRRKKPPTPRRPRPASRRRPTAEAPAESPAGRGKPAEAATSGEGLTCWSTPWSTWSAASSTHPDDVRVRSKTLRRGALLEVRVHPEDLGRVIGRSGRTATALRTVVKALSDGEPVRVDVVDVDRGR